MRVQTMKVRMRAVGEDDFESIDYRADKRSDKEQNEEEQSSEEDMDGVIPLISPYTLQQGVSVTIGGSRPLDIFSQFVPRDILQHI